MAEITTRSLKNEREILYKAVPLNTPFLFGFFLGDICNFKCKYCIQSADEEVAEKKSLIKTFLDWNTFQKIADSLADFPNKIKTILFSSIGEPLLHPDLPKMIQYLNYRNVANAYEIVTNASVLTHNLSDKLIDAGLTRLCISLQGLSSSKYKEICGVELSIEKLTEQIAYFFDRSRGKCKLHVKIIDIALEEGEEPLFYETFEEICDTMHIDKIVPAFKGIDYSEMIPEQDKFGDDVYEVHKDLSCNTIFYTLYTLPDGKIVPCCDNPQPIIYGNIHTISLVEAWNGKLRYEFIKKHLTRRRCENIVCKTCISPIDVIFREDSVAGHEAEILSRLERK